MKKIVILLPIMALLTTGCYRGYSDGERAGTLTKLSNKGLINKTWEGQINLGGTKKETIGKTTNIVANTWDFTVDNEDVAKKLNEKVGEFVEVKYQQEFITAPWRADTNYFITEIK